MAQTRARNEGFFKADPFIEFLDQYLEERTASDLNGGRIPKGRRGNAGQTRMANKDQMGLFLNGIKLHGGGSGTDARSIRAWRNGERQSVSLDTADKLLLRYDLSLVEFEDWAEETGKDYLVNGENRYG